jgi:hypothetical protein
MRRGAQQFGAAILVLALNAGFAGSSFWLYARLTLTASLCGLPSSASLAVRYLAPVHHDDREVSDNGAAQAGWIVATSMTKR